jgi:branched-chain amino acid transport system substrate-binding protein
MKLRTAGTLFAVSAIAFSACTQTPGGSAGPSGAAGGKPAVCENKKASGTEITVYSSLPRQGTNTEQTDTLVEQIRQTLEGKTVGGYTIKYVDLDDSSAANNGDWDGAVAQSNANTAAANPNAMIFIGHYNSGAAKLTIPILNNACIVMISPANTYPGLTKAVEGVTEANEPDTYYPNGYRNYTRVIGTDDAQGAAGAEWAKRLGVTKAYVLDDTQVYGKGLARAWALHANKIGIDVVSPSDTSEGFDAAATDYAALAEKIKAAGADGIYIGSITGQNTGKLWKDLRAALPDITMMSGDGVFEASWYDGAGTAGNDTYLTFGGVGPDQLTGAGATWFEQYKTDHDGEQPSTYTAYGNAAAAVALDALTRAGANANDRYEVLKAVFATNLETVVGPMSFDANGDTKSGSMTGYQVETSWPPTFREVLSVAE